MLSLYNIFHLNLMFSSIEVEDRPLVIKKCYWPLFKLVKMGIPIGIEATGQTLGLINDLDRDWILTLKSYVNKGQVEFIGSGYSQIIGPLVPAQVNDWNQNKDTYINSTENTSTSSINKITNDFIYYYEKLFRANKIGIPAGVFSGSKLPDRVEGYYSKIYSKDLALEAMSAIENFFVGKKYNSEEKGESLESYLNFLNSEKNGTSLNVNTLRFKRVRKKYSFHLQYPSYFCESFF